MLFTKIFSFAILAATAAADLHIRCSCRQDGIYKADITEAACAYYDTKNYPWGRSVYDVSNGQCSGRGDGKLAGDQWEEACQDIGKQRGINNGMRGSC